MDGTWDDYQWLYGDELNNSFLTDPVLNLPEDKLKELVAECWDLVSTSEAVDDPLANDTTDIRRLVDDNVPYEEIPYVCPPQDGGSDVVRSVTHDAVVAEARHEDSTASDTRVMQFAPVESSTVGVADMVERKKKRGRPPGSKSSKKADNNIIEKEHKGSSRVRWSDDEHIEFLSALNKCGRSWATIAKHFGTNKTPEQLASHAQKYFKRQQNQNKKRKSVHDTTLQGSTVDRSGNGVDNAMVDKRNKGKNVERANLPPLPIPPDQHMMHSSELVSSSSAAYFSAPSATSSLPVLCSLSWMQQPLYRSSLLSLLSLQF